MRFIETRVSKYEFLPYLPYLTHACRLSRAGLFIKPAATLCERLDWVSLSPPTPSVRSCKRCRMDNPDNGSDDGSDGKTALSTTADPFQTPTAKKQWTMTGIFEAASTDSPASHAKHAKATGARSSLDSSSQTGSRKNKVVSLTKLEQL